MNPNDKALLRGCFVILVLGTAIAFAILYFVRQILSFEASILFGFAVLLVEIGLIVLAMFDK